MSTASDFSTRAVRGILAPGTYADWRSMASVLDQHLAPVRECLEGLSITRVGYETGSRCWCNSFDEDHSDACLAAQQLYERLKQS